ncbi:hypothetical protein ACP70R_022501 [Stipagrostis hirtigluma subsp. patula]
MASRTASIVGILLILLFLLVPTSSSPRSLVFKLQGNAQSHGSLYVTMKIGDPPRDFHLDVDTGSIVTWLQCVKPDCRNCWTWPQPHHLYKLRMEKRVHSTDPLCQGLLGHPGHHNDPECGYRISYAYGSTEGLLVRDTLSLPINRNPYQTIAFGCGYNQNGQGSPVDGILGLGRGSAVGLISQLKKKNIISQDVFSHCISTRGVGFLFLGGYEQPSRVVTWVPMDRNEKEGHYSPAILAELHFGGVRIIRNPMKVVFDSGSTYTFFDMEPYQATENWVKANLDRSLTEVKEPPMKLCWKGPHLFRTVDEVKKLFKTLSLVFANGNATPTFEIPPENYLIISKSGHVCLAILPGSEHTPLGETNLIGAVTMQDRVMIYDNEQAQLGWIHDSCKTKSKFDSVITSRL